MRLQNHARLKPTELAAIESELGEQRTLWQVVEWGQRPDSGVSLPEVVAEVIAQDEYAHDIIVPWRGSLVLVYGAT